MSKQIKSKELPAETKQIKEDYFYGIGSLIAQKLNLSKTYVRDVLRNKYPERKTKNTREIIELANKLMEDHIKNH
ncbi:hypothetical protein [Aquimarina rhabdastrellae]